MQLANGKRKKGERKKENLAVVCGKNTDGNLKKKKKKGYLDSVSICSIRFFSAVDMMINRHCSRKSLE